MARDMGIVLLGDDDCDESFVGFSDDEFVDVNDEDGEENHEVEVEEVGQSIQADMARFPGKTRKQVMAARA